MDDSPEYPMAFAFRLHVAGSVQRQLFEMAVESAVEQHPLLRASLATVDETLCWVEAEPQSIVTWIDAAVDGVGSSRRPNVNADTAMVFDLRSGPGLRIFVRTTAATECELVFQFHHACSDGIGGFRFIDDVLVAYHNAWCDKEDTPIAIVKHSTLDPQVLPERANTRRLQSRWTLPYRIGLGVSRAVRFLTREPIQISCDQTDSGNPSPAKSESTAQCNGVDYRFDPGILERLRDRAAQRSSSLNDVLLATAFTTLFAWQSRQQNGQGRVDRPTGFLRLGVPVNLRARRHVRLSAANVVSVTFLDRTAQQVSDKPRLLAGITQQMNGIKNRKSATFVKVIRYLGNHKWFRHMVGSDRVFMSATVSNLGPVLSRSKLPRTSEDQVRFANAVVEDVEIQGPVRGTMTVFLAVFSYAKRLKSSLAYDVKTFGANDASRLNTDFADQLTAFANVSGPATPAGPSHSQCDAKNSIHAIDNVDA